MATAGVLGAALAASLGIGLSSVSAPAAAVVSPAYRLATVDGTTLAFTGVDSAPTTERVASNRPIVGIAATPDNGGSWLVATDGGVFCFGDAGFFGSTGALTLNRPIVGMAATPDGRGYWLVATDGGVFAFGDAGFFGSTGALTLQKPIVGMAATPGGQGYWLVASDGGVFAFGDAPFAGSGVTAAPGARVVGITGSGNPATLRPPPGGTTTTTSPSSPTTTTTGPGFPNPLFTQLAGLHLMNYYPSQNAWSYMWQNWNGPAMDADFATMAGLGANAVRIVVQPWAVGYPAPSATMVARLASTIASAQSHGLKVQLTLFDWWSTYSDVAGSTAWARAIVGPYAGNPEIAFVELQNEIDPTNAAAMAWARAELPAVRQIGGSIPVTLSVNGTDTNVSLTELKSALGASQPDFYDVHFYNQPGNAYGELARDRAIAAPLPLFVGETGQSTYPTSGQSAPVTDVLQDNFLRNVEWATAALGLPAAAPWIFQDFAPGAVPPQEANAAFQSAYGLLRVDGTQKPAAAAVRQVFTTGQEPGLNDGTFAAADGGQPVGWIPFDPTDATFGTDPTTSHAGGGSVTLSASAGSSTLVPGWSQMTAAVPTATGQRFTATAWAKGAGVTGTNTISISWFSAAGAYLGASSSAPLANGSPGWTQLSVTSAAPAGAAWDEIHLKSANNTGTVWYSNVGLVVS